MNANANPVAYKLKVPIVLGTETISELKFKKPKLKHLRALDGVDGSMSIIAIFVEKLAGLNPIQVDELDPADFEGIAEIVKSFFPNAQVT